MMKQKSLISYYVLLTLLLAACQASTQDPTLAETSPESPAPTVTAIEPAPTETARPVVPTPPAMVEPTATAYVETNRETAPTHTPAPLVYVNERYGFRVPLPPTWAGYEIAQQEHGDITHICFTFPDTAPVCVLQIDVFTREAWERAVDMPPDYYRGENERFVIAAGPYGGPCVQLDEFQCARHREIPDVLAGLAAQSIGEAQTEPVYHNDTFGFRLTLPETWRGYQITEHDHGVISDICFTFPEHGHICVLKIDVHTRAGWDTRSLIPPGYYLAENDQYVFAAGPYHNLEACVQLDRFQCDRRQEVPAILASFRFE